MKKFFIYSILIASVLVTTPTRFADASDVSVKNTGVVPANIWYSKEPFYSGETIRIFTVIYNGSAYDLSGSVEFLDNDSLVGRTTISLLASGQVRDVSVPWKATEGKHAITARIVDASISLKGGQKTAITLENAEAGKSEITVEVDPAVKAAQAQAEAEKVAAAGTQVTGTVNGAIQSVSNVIPEPVKVGTVASANAVEQVRATLEAEATAAKEQKGKDIDSITARAKLAAAQPNKASQKPGVVESVTNGMEKPFAYVMYGTFAVLQYFFMWKIVFYGTLFYIVYRLIKWGIQKFRERKV